MADTVQQPYNSRRGHNPHISITDSDHHITEAIGGMYDTDDEDGASGRHKPRPLSFIVSPKESYINQTHISSNLAESKLHAQRTPLSSTIANDRVPQPATSTGIGKQSLVGSENGGPMSPPPSLSRQNSADTAVQQFPLNDIDYESSPAAVAQELSNLQAIRRMSMSVDTADPDLPAFSAVNNPPSPNTDENDASRLFWVPARLHPELAPTEFKTFIEERVDKMKRRSGDGASLLLQGLDRSESFGIKRKKSMLSRQVDPVRAKDETSQSLERNVSASSSHTGPQGTDLATLASLVDDPTSLIRSMSIGDGRKSQDSGIGVPLSDDLPKLGLSGLKRSTRTNYRKGSVRKGERVLSTRRVIDREKDSERESASGPDSPPHPEDPTPGITRASTEPAPLQGSASGETADNFSRPGRSRRGLGISTSAEDLNDKSRIEQAVQPTAVQQTPEVSVNPVSPPQPFISRIAQGGRTTAQLPGEHAPVPQIIETPPSVERPAPGSQLYPQRGSSRGRPPMFPSPRTVPLINGARSRPSLEERDRPEATLDDLSSNPRILPGSGNMRTDDLTLVPTMDAVKKTEKKETSRKPSWGWLLGSEDEKKEKKEEKKREEKRLREAKQKEEALEKEKEKQRQKEREKERVQSRKPKISSRLAPSETVRLDLLQTSIDGSSSRGRESLVLDRDSIKLDEARKETGRKSSDGRKEKDGSILSAIFGGGKRSKDEHARKRSTSRGLSPEPPRKPLGRADIDYNWTRFSILEERAIYRLAHIKLANPKRALYSQVLLSNFMYSYLAKVQMMHPQIQVSQQPQQQQQQSAMVGPAASSAGASQPQHSQPDSKPDEYLQYQRWQEQQGQGSGPHAAETGVLSNGYNAPLDAYSMYNHNAKPAQGNYPPQYDGSGDSNGHAGRDRDTYDLASQQQHHQQQHGSGQSGQAGHAAYRQQQQQQQQALYNSNSWGDDDNMFHGS